MADGSDGPERPERQWVGTYILRDDKIAIPEYDMNAWAKWMQKHGTRVRYNKFGSWSVSTIFLGLDYGHRMRDPILFETMAFWLDRRSRRRYPRSFDLQPRYSTWAEAISGHKTILRQIQRVAAHKEKATGLERYLTPRERRGITRFWQRARATGDGRGPGGTSYRRGRARR